MVLWFGWSYLVTSGEQHQPLAAILLVSTKMQLPFASPCFCRSMAFFSLEVVCTPPDIRTLSVSWCFCKIIGVRGCWNTPTLCVWEREREIDGSSILSVSHGWLAGGSATARGCCVIVPFQRREGCRKRGRDRERERERGREGESRGRDSGTPSGSAVQTPQHTSSSSLDPHPPPHAYFPQFLENLGLGTYGGHSTKYIALDGRESRESNRCGWIVSLKGERSPSELQIVQQAQQGSQA